MKFERIVFSLIGIALIAFTFFTSYSSFLLYFWNSDVGWFWPDFSSFFIMILILAPFWLGVFFLSIVFLGLYAEIRKDHQFERQQKAEHTYIEDNLYDSGKEVMPETLDVKTREDK